MMDTSATCLIDTDHAPTLEGVARRKSPSTIPLSPLARWREKRHLTQQQVAALTRTSQQNVDRMEKRPITALTVEWILKFARALDVPALALIVSEVYDEADAALLQVARRLSPPEKARLLMIATTFEAPLKIA